MIYKLRGPQGNAFDILAFAQKRMRHLGKSKTEIDEFLKVAVAADYPNLLKTVSEYTDITFDSSRAPLNLEELERERVASIDAIVKELYGIELGDKDA